MEDIFLIYPENRQYLSGLQKELAQQIKMKPREKIGMFIFAGSFLIAGVILVIVAFYYLFLYVKINHFGAKTYGQYINSRILGDGDDTEYRITYTFEVNGKKYTKESQVSRELYTKYKNLSYPQDEPLTIYYDPKNPNRSFLKPPSLFFVFLFFVFAIIWNLFCNGIIYLLVKDRNKLKTLSKHGRIIDGKLINCSGYTDEGDFYIKGEYNFISPSTRDMIQGKFHSLREDLRNQKLPGIGTKVKVIYLNDKTFDVL